MTPARNRRTTTVTDVASFTVDDELQHPADFFLIRDGGVALFLGNQVLEQAQAELALLGYTDVRVDLGRGELERVHDQFSSNLAFPDYYGRNLDALNDCLGDVARGDYGWDATTTGLAVTVYRFSQLHGQHPQVALPGRHHRRHVAIRASLRAPHRQPAPGRRTRLQTRSRRWHQGHLELPAVELITADPAGPVGTVT